MKEEFNIFKNIPRIEGELGFKETENQLDNKFMSSNFKYSTITPTKPLNNKEFPCRNPIKPFFDPNKDSYINAKDSESYRKLLAPTLKTPVQNLYIYEDAMSDNLIQPTNFKIMQSKKMASDPSQMMSSPNGKFMIGNHFTTKINNISPDQPVQYNFASKNPRLYSSSISNQHVHSNQKPFHMMLHPAGVGMVNPFMTDQMH